MGEDARSARENRLRESLATVLGLAPGAVRADSPLAELLPEPSRRELWSAWEKAAAIRLPALDHTRGVKFAWFAGGFLSVLFVLAFLRTLGIHLPASMMVGGVAGLLAGAVGMRWLAPPGTSFPLHVNTVADLAAWLEAREH